jgi:hypothetical protein
MSYIVVARNPSNNRLLALMDEYDCVMSFKSRDEANSVAQSAIAFVAWGFEVVEVSE